MSEVLVKVESVSKKFCKTLKRSMLYGIQDILRSMIGMESHTEDLRSGEFWSVNDVSFELKRGECLGLIGSNGAGKSTLLKILNGIMSPDKGRIEIKGRVGALIEVTAGFHPMLTGRENIYINGAILGFSKKEIDKRYDDIVAFSELNDFLDTPVKHYSSGMNVRLGFAIAVQMKPDVLLIDEVLAVGDIGFRIKCLNAITEISKNAAVIFVSHSIPQIARTCSNICVMDKGKTIYSGKDVLKGIEHHYSSFTIQKGIISGNGKAKIYKIDFESKDGEKVEMIHYMDTLHIHLFITIDIEIQFPIVNVAFKDQTHQMIAQCSSNHNKVNIHNTGGFLHIRITLNNVIFNPGIYLLTVSVVDKENMEVLTFHHDIKQLRVIGDFIGWTPLNLMGEWRIDNEELLS